MLKCFGSFAEVASFSGRLNLTELTIIIDGFIPPHRFQCRQRIVIHRPDRRPAQATADTPPRIIRANASVFRFSSTFGLMAAVIDVSDVEIPEREIPG